MKKSVVVFLARLYDHRNALLLGNALSETKKKRGCIRNGCLGESSSSLYQACNCHESHPF